MGTRGTVPYLGLGMQAGTYGGAGGLKTIAYKEAGADEFDVRDDGTIELVLSATPPANGDTRNWLPLPAPTPESTRAMLIVRQTFKDRATRRRPTYASSARAARTVRRPSPARSWRTRSARRACSWRGPA
jgi:hypothetical protein